MVLSEKGLPRGRLRAFPVAADHNMFAHGRDAWCKKQQNVMENKMLPTGLEPVTFRLLAECSNQLSYESLLYRYL